MNVEDLQKLITDWLMAEGEKPGRCYVSAGFGDELVLDGDFNIRALAQHIVRQQQKSEICAIYGVPIDLIDDLALQKHQE